MVQKEQFREDLLYRIKYDTRRDPALEGAAGGYRTAYRDIHHEIYQYLR